MQQSPASKTCRIFLPSAQEGVLVQQHRSMLSRLAPSPSCPLLLLGKLVFGIIALVRPRWRPSVCVRLRSRGKTLRCTGANKTLMPLMPCEFRCAGMIPCGGAYLRCRRYGWPCSGDEGPRGPGTRRTGRGHRVRGRWRRGQGV
jgi:hypothetical protein